MANLKVITNTAYSNHSTQLRGRRHIYHVREDEAEYQRNRDEFIGRIQSLLDAPLWPGFPDGVYLKADEAERLYRLAHGVQGLAHILNRSAHLRGRAQDYDGEPDIWLNEFEESQVWGAMIEMARDLAGLADDWTMTPTERH